MKQLKYTQYGLSMVELLVSLAISSFLILGVTQVYIDNKRNYIFQQGQASNQENARFAELTLNTLLGQAGYRRAPMQNMGSAFPQVSTSGECASFLKGAVITALSDSKDGFCMRYQPALSSETDCQGNVVNMEEHKAFIEPALSETVILAIKFIPETKLGEGALKCKNLSGENPAFEVLVSGVADVRFEFGVCSSDICDRKLKDENPWVSAPSTTELVRAVRYSMLFASDPNQRDGVSNIFDNWISEGNTSTNKRLTDGDQRNIYQQASSTQTLRNMVP